MQVTSDKHVILIGVGNIGSHLVPHLGRLPGVTRISVIDPDVYEAGNLATQDIVPADVGKAKVRVQARRLRRINPRLEVRAISRPVEVVPVGDLRCHVILTGLDSRRARQVVNDRVLHLGVPWIDGGLDGTERLARITTYIPGRNRPCLECDWNDGDYDAVEQTFPCQGVEPAASIAASYLGGITAALLANEGCKLLAGDYRRVAAGRQVLMDVAHHNYYVSTLRHNRDCRLAPHDVPPIGQIDSRPLTTTLGGLFNGTNSGTMNLQVLGQTFRTQLTCTRCGHRRPYLRLEASPPRSQPRPCRLCGGEMATVGFDKTDRLHIGSLTPNTLMRSLGSIGVRPRDVIRIEVAESEDVYIETDGALDEAPRSHKR